MGQQGSHSNTGRLEFIDWTRGLAAVVMLQGHTFHSFTSTELRTGGPYMLSQFLGGLPPAIFLFLTGLTFAFLMDSQERKGLGNWERVVGALKRSRYLFLLAVLFRLQLYIFGFPTSPASELLRVDILNCMGFAMLLLAPMAVFSTAERIRLCSVLGLVIAFLAPVVSAVDVSRFPALLSSYVVPSYSAFGFFPWAAFLAFGMVAGSVIRTVTSDQLERTMLWMLGIGLTVIMAAHYLSNLPYSLYPKVDYWLDSPGLTTIKLGAILVILSVSYLWMKGAAPSRASLLRQLGTTSLLVYWVHIELVYGRWFGIWKEKLTVPQVLVYTVCLIALMTLLSVWRTRGSSIFPFRRSTFLPQPERSSGD